MDRRVFICLLVIWAKVEASNTTTGSSLTVILKVFENCVDKNDSLSCLQQKVLNFATRMTQSKSLEIFEGFKLVRDEQTARSISDSKSDSSGTTLSHQIWNKVDTFFRTHSVEVNLSKFLDTDTEARKKKGYGGMMLMVGAVKGAMMYMGMLAIAALAGKALLVAKVALTIASVIALKKLLEGSSGKTSYEIIKHPQHTYVQTHSSSHEYGGAGGHGGGYEGHYRKRSIVKTNVNVDKKYPTGAKFDEASDSWRFELPKTDAVVKFSTDLNDPNESQQANDGALKKGGEFFLYKQIADESQSENSKRNLFALNKEDKSGEKLKNNYEFSGLRLRRSLLTKFL